MKTKIIIFLVCFSHTAIAESYKCIQSGRTIYSSSPCGDNAQVVQNHVTPIDGPPSTIYQEPNSDQMTSHPPVKAPVQVAVPSQVPAPVIKCDYEEAEFEAVKKAMRAGYPDSQSNYWHERFVNARDAYDLCRERLQKSLPKKY